MDESLELKLYGMQDTHWWFQGRRDMLFKLLSDVDRGARILDMGCYGGALISFLKGRGFVDVSGIDISERAVDYCRSHGVPAIRGDCSDPAFDSEEFDVIVASDILEHIEDDMKALRGWNRILRRGGKLIVFTPAFELIWSEWDEMAHHYRRYSRKRLVKAVGDAGFEVERSSYWNMMLLFPTMLLKIPQMVMRKVVNRVSRGRKRGGQSVFAFLFKLDSWILFNRIPLVNSTLKNMLKVENMLLDAGMDFPAGVSVFVVARKP